MHVPEAWLPVIHRPGALDRALIRARARRGWKRLQDAGCTTRVLHLWHPQFAPALSVPCDLSIYHVQDDYSFVAEPPPPNAEELEVLRGSDQVFFCSAPLLERKGGFNAHSAHIPNGVDYALYSRDVAEPLDLRGIPHPRFGYAGHLKNQLDWPLLHTLATRHPEWSFVFVGRVNPTHAELPAAMAPLKRLPNVHFLGEKEAAELAAYPQHFDACIMPYRINGYTDNVYPLKLHESLASGRPVVSAAIRSLESVREQIALARTADEWSTALACALELSATAAVKVAERRAVARAHDWNENVYRIARVICERLGPSYLERLAKVEIPSPRPS